MEKIIDLLHSYYLDPSDDRELKGAMGRIYNKNYAYFNEFSRRLSYELASPLKNYQLLINKEGINIVEVASDRQIYPILAYDKDLSPLPSYAQAGFAKKEAQKKHKKPRRAPENKIGRQYKEKEDAAPLMRSMMLPLALELATSPLNNPRWSIMLGVNIKERYDEVRLDMTASCYNEILDSIDDDRMHLPALMLPSTTCFGLGGGLYLQALVESGYHFHSLLVYEEDIDFFKISCFFLDYAALFDACGERACYLFIENLVNRYFIEHYFSSHKVSNNFMRLNLRFQNSQKISQAIAIVDEAFYTNARGWGTFEDEMIGFNNTLYNIGHNRVLKEFGKVNAPILVAGAGPSLASSLEFIRQNIKNMIVFSCGTALKPLLDNGIVPDFQIEIERVDYLHSVLSAALSSLEDGEFERTSQGVQSKLDSTNSQALEKKADEIPAKAVERKPDEIPAKSIERKQDRATKSALERKPDSTPNTPAPRPRLLCASVVDPRVLALQEGALCFMRGGSASAYLCKSPSIEYSAPFVGVAGVSLASIMGSDVLLSGIDCGYIEGATKHVEGSYYGEEEAELPPSAYEIRGNTDKRVYATPIFSLAIRNIEAALKNYKSNNTLNLGQGAYIEGAIYIGQEDFELEEIDKKEACAKIEALFAHAAPFDKEGYLAKIEVVKGNLCTAFGTRLASKEALFTQIDALVDIVHAQSREYKEVGILFEGSIKHVLQAIMIALLFSDMDIEERYSLYMQKLILLVEKMSLKLKLKLVLG